MTESSSIPVSAIAIDPTAIEASGSGIPAGKSPTTGYLVGVLYYGPIDREHDRCMRALKEHPLVAQTFEMHGCPYIDIGRSALASKALDDGYQGILFVDHDMLFDLEGVTLAIEGANATEGVVGAAYSMRRPGVEMIGGIDSRKLDKDKPVKFFEGGELVDAVYLGMGFTAISSKALQRIVDHAEIAHERRHARIDILERLVNASTESPTWQREMLDLLKEVRADLQPHAQAPTRSGITTIQMRPFFRLHIEDDKYFGEDVSFCLRAHAAGVPVKIDTRIRVYHKGSYCYGLEDCGFVVPYCNTLVTLLGDAPAPQYTQHSPNPEIQREVEQRRELDAAPEIFPTAQSL